MLLLFSMICHWVQKHVPSSLSALYSCQLLQHYQHCTAVSFYSITLDGSYIITLVGTVQNIASNSNNHLPQKKRHLPLHKLKQLQQSKHSIT